MKKLIYLSGLLAVVFITSCEKDYYKPAAVVDLSVQVSFKNEIVPVFVANCYGSGCHDKGTAPKLNGTAQEIYDELTMNGYVDTLDATGSKLYARLIGKTKPMPPKGTLSADVTNKVLAWIKQGAHIN